MLKVLVADDDEHYRNLIQTVLKKAGYAVITASSGTEAFQKVLQEKPEMAVLDVNMPGMTGFEVCKKIRLHPDHKNMPILIFTVLSEVEHQLAGYELGADEYLPKPCSLDVFIARIKTLEHRILGQGGE